VTGEQDVSLELWTRAYDTLKQDDEKLVSAYEAVLGNRINGALAQVTVTVNPLSECTAQTRISLMKSLINDTLKATELGGVAELATGAAEVLKSAQEIVGGVLETYPAAALAWSGICAVLPVSAYRLSNLLRCIDMSRCSSSLSKLRKMLPRDLYMW
jgi:hypothetical protein